MTKTNNRWTAFVVAIAVLIATPLAVVASDVFTDVPDNNVFHDDITWLADAGVTKGCNPPDNTQFCPSDEVTRDQMAAFMRRLAENKVVDAATAITAETAGDAENANNSSQLGGVPSGQILGALPVAWAMVDKDSTAITRGYGISSVSSPSTGVYCLAIDPALEITRDETVGFATPEWGTSLGFDLLAYWYAEQGTCTDEEFQVRTYDFAAGGNPVLSDDVSFTILLMYNPMLTPASGTESPGTNGS